MLTLRLRVLEDRRLWHPHFLQLSGAELNRNDRKTRDQQARGRSGPRQKSRTRAIGAEYEVIADNVYAYGRLGQLSRPAAGLVSR